jgi:hypothetical protein
LNAIPFGKQRKDEIRLHVDIPECEPHIASWILYGFFAATGDEDIRVFTRGPDETALSSLHSATEIVERLDCCFRIENEFIKAKSWNAVKVF